MKSVYSVICLSVALGLLLYAVPRLEIGQGLTLSGIFSIVWLGMILLIIAAHLHRLLGVDEETQQEMDRVRLYKQWRTRQWLSDRIREREKGRL
jgi:hypothetical protein